MLKRIAFPIIVILIAISLAVPVMAESGKQRAFLPAGAVDAVGLIGHPPERGSPEFETQMEIVLWLQQTRTPDQVTFVEQPLNLARFAPLISTSLLGVDGQLLNETLDGVIDEVRMDYDAVKAVFDEPRPFQVDSRVKPVGDARPVASYPSGHAIRATVYGTLLADMFPEHSAEITQLARQVGYGRVVAGVHYPLDVSAGQKLGAAYASEIINQPAYREAVEAIFEK
ncbi:phosphatase PAP2 family protein [Hoeflea prorocentri]|uniref:Phosphatase PAP2 family protein n=1 Tax=Hoeflea prorocentri TaxID=1922333 RepID=A0A9X3UKV5_9HYPH|nr:phosphatase PAP2 family protein [Hoeflea prorocentri]MCY6381034.1 phosphatase PAP2 family protein [Hoeflea prorocentri]MDA5398834.1 phosphatase PAP2 family protein [Hoeflea prorocentri]